MNRAIEQAALELLQTSVASGGAGYDRKTSGLGPPDGQPPPECGAFYVTVHASLAQQTQECTGEEEFTLRVTVSERIDVPWDRIGSDLMNKALRGINDRIAAIKAVFINGQYTLMNRANALTNAMPGGPYDGLVEPFLTVSENSADLVSGDWFHAEAEESAAVRKTLQFRGARRVQKIGNLQVQYA